MLAFYRIWGDTPSSIFSYFGYEFFIDAIHLIGLESISIGRITNNDTFKRRIGDIIAYSEIDIIEDSSSFGITLGYLYHVWIYITGIDMILATRIYLTPCGISNHLEHLTIIEWEFFYSKMSKKSWGDITSNHNCFYRNCARTTERIGEGNRVFPVSKCNECCGKIFLDGSFSCFSAISSLMERISSDIEENMRDIVDDENEDMYLDTIREIWSIQCTEYGSLSNTLESWYTLQSWSCRRCFDNNSFFSSEILTPLESIQSIIELIEIIRFFSSKLDIDSIRKSTPDEEFIHIPLCPSTRYETILDLYICTSETLTFSLDERLDSRLTSENKATMSV